MNPWFYDGLGEWRNRYEEFMGRRIEQIESAVKRTGNEYYKTILSEMETRFRYVVEEGKGGGVAGEMLFYNELREQRAFAE